MNAEDFANILRLARSAPLRNMDEAEYVAALLQRFAEYADKMTSEIPEKPHELREVE